ncbi:MAG TPA: phage major capsid protein [Cyclobacteriaceae bacterium]|nr:phage major capsid protein [Cyclobacteriaceae bacterium]
MDTQKHLQELRSQLAKAESDMKAIFDKAVAETRSRTPEEVKSFDTLEASVKALKVEISAFEEQIKRDAADAKPVIFDTPGKTDVGKSDVKNIRTAKVANFFRAANPALNYRLEGVEKELADDASKEFKTFGNNLEGFDPSVGSLIPAKVLRHLAWNQEQMEKRDVQATGSGLGIELVNTDTLASNYVQALRNQNVLMNAGVRVIQNDSGANMVFPRESSLYTAAMAATENAAASESLTATAFVSSPLTFSPKRGTGYVQVSNQAFLQYPWWEPFLREQIVLGNATLMDTQGINGSGGSGQARGILNTSNTQTVVGGTNGANFARSHITSFESGVGGAGGNLNNSVFITNFAVNAYGKKTEISSGSGRFLVDASPMWSFMDRPTGKGAQSQIDQYPAFLSNNVPSNLTKGTSTTICSAIIFGDVSKMVYMNFGGLQVIVDPYVNATTALTNYVVHFWFDFNVILPGAVSFSADMLTP